jgi:RNA polymerase sigma-70 factor (ECF subfamily)
MEQRNKTNGEKEQDHEVTERLVEKVQKGDMPAFSRLYDLYVEKIYKYFYFKTSQEEAFDLTETVFLKVWDNIKSYKQRPGSSFTSWIFRIAHNLLVDHYRFDKASVELDASHADQKIDNSPVFLAEQSLSRRSLRQAMSRLKDPYREVITLAFMNGLDNPELARVLHKSEGTLRVLKFRALRELKKILEDLGIKYQ